MAENYGTLEGTLDEHGVLSGEMSDRATLEGEIQFGSGGGGVLDVFQNGQSVVEGRKAYVTVPTLLRELRSDDYHNTVTTFEIQNWNGKADPSDIPTALSQLDNDDNYVQDADYVHTDNNFTNEDKTAIGNIPENITDLSDVAVDNIQNGQVLKWDATQEKFVNADESGGGSGDVADVKVNGTSVVDPVTKEANIDLTGYAETSDIPTDLADLSDDATHRLVTDTEKSTWDNKADVSDIPTINNNTITIQKNGQNVDSFTLNQDSNKAINIAVPTKTSDLQNDDSFITNTVNNLANYYLKSDTYTQTEVNNLISAAVNGRFEKVTTLPASGEPNVIYLVPKTTALTNNVYDEYIWQDNTWELLGSTEIDLSNYVTTTDLSTALADYVTSSTFNTTIANYYTKTEVGNLLDGKVDKVSGKGLSTYDYDATAKGIVDNVTTNLAGKVDKVNGKGLSTEDYTTTEKNKLAGISTGANKVESSTTNGNIRIDGTETQVYDGSGKVDKVNGKGLSTNDYDNTDKAKVDKINTTTTSISGNPISISGLKSNQLAANPIITLEPIQAGSGTPSPSNIRAISGYDKIEALSCGKNLFDGTYSVTGYFLRNDGSEYPGTFNITQYIVVKPNTAYYFTELSGATSACICWYNQAKEFISATSITAGFTATSPVNAFYLRASVRDGKTNVCINEGNTAITYVPYDKATSISESLGQTVYGGTLDVRTGEFIVDSGYYTFDGTEIWTLNSTNGNAQFEKTDMKLGVNQSGICSKLAQGNSSGNILFGSGNNKIYLLDVINQYSLDTVAKIQAFTTKMQIVYPLATPFTIQLTPHEISLLKDYAYVSTNGTTIALDYHNGELASLSDVAQLGETVNELGDKVSANDAGTQVNLMIYNTSSNKYVCPSDGYISLANSGVYVDDYIIMNVYGANDNLICGLRCDTSVASIVTVQNLFVKRGMKCYVRATSSTGSFTALFTPLA